jgi:hypothetical protein
MPILTSMRMAYELCLATAGKQVPSGPDWIHEVKHDGYRMLVIRENKRTFARRHLSALLFRMFPVDLLASEMALGAARKASGLLAHPCMSTSKLTRKLIPSYSGNSVVRKSGQLRPPIVA